MIKNIVVIIIDGNKPLVPKDSKINVQNFIPNIAWIIASNNGVIKNIAISLNKALLIIFSSVPRLRRILKRFLLSLLSLNSFKAKMAALDIRKIMPR